jgi:DnaJ-class molecular chaperone
MRGDYGQPPPDAELARRAAVVLEDYLRHAQRLETDAGRGDRRRPAQRKARGAPMGVEEAHDVLGLEPGASADAVRAAHRRLVQLVHPDRGGSNYLAAKINEAKEILLAQSVRRPSTSARGRARVTRKQTAPAGQPNAAGGPET